MTDSALTLVDRASVLTDLKRAPEAIALLHRAAGLTPDDQRLWCEFARAQLACDRPTEALQAINTAVGLDPEEEWPHRLASIALRMLGQHDGAVQAARESVRLAPHAWQTFVQLAEALAGHPSGQSVAGSLYPQATSAAARAIELAPFEAEAHVTMGHVLLAHPDAYWAAQAFREALRLRPDDSRARNGLGVANLRRGDLASAAGDFGAAAGADPRDRIARRNVNAAAWNAARNMCALLVGMILVLSPTVEAPWPVVRYASVLLCIALIGALAVRAWRRVPPTMRGYLFRLLRREPLLGATLFFAACSILLMAFATVPTSPDDRTGWFGTALLATALAVLVRWIGVSRHNRAVDRGMTEDASELVQRATVLIDVKRGTDAVALLHRAVALAPDDQTAWCELGRAELTCDRPQNALAAANRALGVDPAQEWPHRLASIALNLLDQHDGAVRAAREAVRLAPHAWQTHTQLADALAVTRRLGGPVASCVRRRGAAANRAIELSPLEADPHCTIGHLLVASQAAPRAERAFREALRLDPGNARAVNGLGLVGMRAGRLVSAAADFGAAAAADPYDSVARGNISAAVWNATRTMYWVLLAAAIGCVPLQPLPVQVGWGAAVAAALGLGVSGVLLWRRVPRSMHGYLLRLPLRDRWLGATLVMGLITVGLIGIAMLAPAQDLRRGFTGVALQATFALAVVRWIGVLRYGRARR